MKYIITLIIFAAGISFVGYQCSSKRNKDLADSGYTIPSMTAEQRDELINIADKTDLSLQAQKQWKDFWRGKIVPVTKKGFI